MRTMYILRTDDRPTTDLAFWKLRTAIKIISATDHPIRFMFGSRVGFSRSVDRVTLHAVLENPKGGRPPSWKISNGHIGSCNSLRVWFYSRVSDRVGGSNVSTSGWTKFKITTVSRLA